MPGLTTHQLALYTRDAYKTSRETYKQAETKHDMIYKVVTGVEGGGNKEQQILGAGALVRHTVEGQDINHKTPKLGWPYYVKYWTYSDGIALTKEAVEDTLKLGNLIKELAGTWGISVRVAEEEMGAAAFNSGGDLLGEWVFNGSSPGLIDPSGDLMYDSKPMFNLTGNTRSTKGGGTYYNSIAGLTMDTDDFEQVYALHTSVNNRDERDRVISNPADTILTPTGRIQFKVDRIFGTPRSAGLPGTDFNDINPYYGKVTKTIAWDYLNDYTAPAEVFYLLKRNTNMAQFHKRQAPEIRFYRHEPNRGYRASIDIRQGLLFRDFRWVTRGGGTAA